MQTIRWRVRKPVSATYGVVQLYTMAGNIRYCGQRRVYYWRESREGMDRSGIKPDDESFRGHCPAARHNPDNIHQHGAATMSLRFIPS